MRLLPFITLGCCFIPFCGFAEDAPTPAPDKSGYWLFNPTPDDQMREFSSDRPGNTHSSTTVDAGHFQVESDFINYTYDRYSANQQSYHTFIAGTPIVKAGITNWADLELGFAFYNENRTTSYATNTSQTAYGFGDILVGSKINLFGNDGGAQSLALLPFVKFPTASQGIGNGVKEYTLNVPYTIALSDPWSLTIEPAVGLLKNVNDNGLHGNYDFLINLSRTVFSKNITAAVELSSEFSADHNIPNIYTFDPSLQWLVTPAVQLDVGMLIGLNRAAPDLNSYTGISFRF